MTNDMTRIIVRHKGTKARRHEGQVTTCLRAFVPSCLLSLLVAGSTFAQQPPGTQPAATMPAHNGNGATTHITSQPGGGLLVNFQDASIDSVLNELSAVAGFIVVK